MNLDTYPVLNTPIKTDTPLKRSCLNTRKKLTNTSCPGWEQFGVSQTRLSTCPISDIWEPNPQPYPSVNHELSNTCVNLFLSPGGSISPFKGQLVQIQLAISL